MWAVEVMWRFEGYVTTTQSCFSMNRWVVKVMWSFEGYITSTQSGFSMNRWVHGHGTVEDFSAITTRERAVKNEENLLSKRMSKMYSPKERGNILTCLLLVSTSSSFFTACSSHQQSFDLFLPENGLF